ncbi:outer membrane beta-barrel protein [Pedobacter sp. SYSU D00535]|uniref:outer membrane beta-barrel protein n=1 Tax=Pedobacter sp. SYSU D00535 TaxID=2810308 RepID=UPI001A96E873|nr:outer membrane beta-barrel protein [Pedobacter sp. SYSU D00535]
MKDQFDDLLVNRIKDIFEDYEDDTASVGWEDLRKRFPGEPEKKPVVLWWRYAAAIALIATAGWLFLGNEQEKIYLTGKTKPTEEAATARVQDDILEEQQTTASQTDGTNIKPELQAEMNEIALISGSAYNETQKPSAGQQDAVTDHDDQFFTQPSTETPREDVVTQENFPNEVKENLVAAASQNSEKTTTLPAETEPGKPESIALALAKLPELPDAKKDQPKKNRGISIGVYAGSYINYAEGSESNINTGFGVQSEFTISKKLKISTGVALAQNNLNFSGSIPAVALDNFTMQPTETSRWNAGLSPAGSYLAETYNIQKYNASLLGLDIPINMKYVLLDNKNQLFVTAGLSSNFFIEESYTYSYNVSGNYNGIKLDREDEKAETEAQTFDFARMLNFSVGMGHPLGKKSRISYEPFLKYPLGGLGAQNIRFGAAGLNLKLNFSTTKK